jgi:hypothetical protein
MAVIVMAVVLIVSGAGKKRASAVSVPATASDATKARALASQHAA